jgi:hypothetical protein
MTQPELQTHEAKVRLFYEPLSIYWALSDLLHNYADGYAETTAMIDGEQWDIRINFSDSGIAPRPSDDITRETVREFDLTGLGRGERKLSVNFSPRWDGLETPDGDPVDTPWQFMDRQGVDAFTQGSNILLDAYPGLVARFVAEIGDEIDHNWNQPFNPFGGQIVEVERYLRLHREMNKKLVGKTGVFQRLMMCLAEQPGTQAELSIDNEDVVGKYRAIQLYSEDVAEVFQRHTAAWGRQIKSYLPRHPEAHDEEDPLYHPKVAALFRNSLSPGSVDWEQRDELLSELDESVLNVLSWSDVPTDVGGGTGVGTTVFVADDHFESKARFNPLTIYPDPTPELEAKQESILMWALQQVNETKSDRDIVEALADGGGRMHREDLADATGWSMSTLYRALQRLEGAIESRNGHFRFSSRQLYEEIDAIVSRLEEHWTTAKSQAERLLDVEIRSKSNSSFERFLAKYGAEFIDQAEGGRPVIRIGTVLSMLKSTDAPRVEAVLDELKRAWRNDRRNIDDIRGAVIEADLVTRDGYQAIL